MAPLTSLSALSPLDGRYARETEPLREHFSECALIRERVRVEIAYFLALSEERQIPEVPPLDPASKATLIDVGEDFDEEEAMKVKAIEKTTRHDVKAVEYYLQKVFESKAHLQPYTSFIHFGLTSEDVNNLSYGQLIERALETVMRPALGKLSGELWHLSAENRDTDLLSLTHGQPATPTTLGKEFAVFASRLDRQLEQLRKFKMHGKLGGAVGNFAAHRAAYPDVNWEAFRDRFVTQLGLLPLEHTTQINPHDDLAELSHLFVRIDSILLDFVRDVWSYISRGVFRQTPVAGEVGSSTMPHKVNPIDFENAEGNLGIATALLSHFAEKLPVSRLQRDLSDSTVQRSLGTAFGHHLLAVRSILRGLPKLTVDHGYIEAELQAHPEVRAEAIQTVLRKYGVTDAYEQLKDLTRGGHVTERDLYLVIANASIPSEDKDRLLQGLPVPKENHVRKVPT